jgi:uncharacterized repeat protein (TIGR03987 family)
MTGTSTIVITLALVFYTIGVWSERFAGRLKPWHLAFFWLGLACDTVGTGMMIDMAGGLTSDVHGVTGVLAILLMLVHAVWATVVIVRRDERWITSFHKFSIVVWAIWLVPYFSPMFLANARWSQSNRTAGSPGGRLRSRGRHPPGLSGQRLGRSTVAPAASPPVGPAPPGDRPRA